MSFRDVHCVAEPLTLLSCRLSSGLWGRLDGRSIHDIHFVRAGRSSSRGVPLFGSRGSALGIKLRNGDCRGGDQQVGTGTGVQRM
jgi:hypothetical protein